MTEDTRKPQWQSRAIWWVYVALAVIVMTVLAMVVLAICAAQFKWQGFWTHAGQPFATIIAGMAALGAGGLAFYNGERGRIAEFDQWRDEQRLETEKDLRARFIAAAAQLADDKASIRRFGVYVIASLAQDWYELGNLTELQACIDVLAGYLLNPNPTYVDATSASSASAGEDGTVRATIVRVLAARRFASDEPTREKTRYPVLGADLRAVQLDDADLRAASLRQVNLSGASMERVDLGGANLGGADLTGVTMRFANLDRTFLASATLGGNDLFMAHLINTSLGGGKLADTLGIKVTRSTRMYAAQIKGIDLRGLDLKQLDLENAKLVDVLYDESTVWPDGFTPPASAAPGPYD